MQNAAGTHVDIVGPLVLVAPDLNTRCPAIVLRLAEAVEALGGCAVVVRHVLRATCALYTRGSGAAGPVPHAPERSRQTLTAPRQCTSRAQATPQLCRTASQQPRCPTSTRTRAAFHRPGRHGQPPEAWGSPRQPSSRGCCCAPRPPGARRSSCAGSCLRVGATPRWLFPGVQKEGVKLITPPRPARATAQSRRRY